MNRKPFISQNIMSQVENLFVNDYLFGYNLIYTTNNSAVAIDRIAETKALCTTYDTNNYRTVYQVAGETDIFFTETENMRGVAGVVYDKNQLLSTPTLLMFKATENVLDEIHIRKLISPELTGWMTGWNTDEYVTKIIANYNLFNNTERVTRSILSFIDAKEYQFENSYYIYLRFIGVEIDTDFLRYFTLTVRIANSSLETPQVTTGVIDTGTPFRYFSGNFQYKFDCFMTQDGTNFGENPIRLSCLAIRRGDNSSAYLVDYDIDDCTTSIGIGANMNWKAFARIPLAVEDGERLGLCIIGTSLHIVKLWTPGSDNTTFSYYIVDGWYNIEPEPYLSISFVKNVETPIKFGPYTPKYIRPPMQRTNIRILTLPEL